MLVVVTSKAEQVIGCETAIPDVAKLSQANEQQETEVNI